MTTVTQTLIALKSSGASGNTPSAGAMSFGEVALNYADGILYYLKSDGLTIGNIQNTIVPGVNKDVIFNDSGAFGVSANLTYDKTTSNLFSQLVSTNDLNISNQSYTTYGTYTTSSTSQTVVDTTPIATYRTVKYIVQITSGSSYQSEEITVMHNGTTPSIIEYGVIFTGSSLGYFDADINTGSGNLELLFTPVNSSTTLKFVKTTITL